MAQETLISPGVLTRENDLSAITQGPVTVGLALVGPTVTGPVNVPTVVTSYSDFKNRFGGMFTSGGANYEYLTSIAVRNYFQQGGSTILMTRVTSGAYTPATSTSPSRTGLTTPSATLDLTSAVSSGYTASINGTNVILSGSSAQVVFNNASSSINSITDITSSFSSPTMTLTAKTSGISGNLYYYTSGSTTVYFAGGTNVTAFTLETLGTGIIMNNSGSLLSDGSLVSGSNMNVRWEITNANTSSGTFTLLIRQGDDNNDSKTILETYTGVSLDPNQPNYLESVVGNQTKTAIKDADGAYYVQTTGNYRNNSRYVRVKSVNLTTPNYFLNDGSVNSIYTGSIPLNTSGAFSGATGNDIATAVNFFDNISTTTQGLTAGNYGTASGLLNNKDEFDFNLLATPGLLNDVHSSAVGNFIALAENRGDCFYIMDLKAYNSTINSTINQAAGLDSNYAGAYWPWVQVISQETGKLVWVPASTIMPGVYAYNDRVSAEWFAPAGLNRGGLGNVLQAERKLSPTDRDNLYAGKVNPIATFPNVGVAAFGQKTLQKKASALDRINVRRLLINLKRYVGNVSKNLVFEQNTTTTRNSFLSAVTPYLENVQQRQGLYAFKVVMDDTNNTPDVIDRNQLKGQIYLQPTRTAEFVLLDFNILPTGATFGS